MKFHTKVIGCYWQEDEGYWLVKLKQEKPGEASVEFEDRCDLLLHGGGILNSWKVSLRANGCVVPNAAKIRAEADTHFVVARCEWSSRSLQGTSSTYSSMAGRLSAGPVGQ